MSQTRAYHSPRRTRAAAATRRDIVEAARRLFLDRGYAQVTVADIAQAAGTAVKTVYASAGGKAEILREIVGAGVAGSDAEETLRRVRACPDGASALAELARGTRRGNEEHREAVSVLYSALPVHESAEALWAQATTGYREALGEVANHLAATGALRPDLDAARCADLLWLCFGFGAWRTLVAECGWDWDAAERELTRMATGMLLP
ncbi:TetR/AcrR family transcriptional regulator [Actinacidiphila acididurans]|uniref:TetR/AcrR family transcriptional regulator n=1 Tax=Actinacidiphila acididurans TaxID=2784346 RepID=A0ABS2U6W8_9ACTN|nr:TetR/AcrR family transcriptional regulator [Actinacidiphila acididurans]MBM9509903.1 TetR/AcrR family transcriptional regulator [Actinacidiphila acididurans]